MAYSENKGKEINKEITTGSGEIDRKMGGGIPRGSLTLIEGESDAGKSVLTQQMIWGSLNCDCSVTLLTTESTIKNFVKQLDSIGLGILDHLLVDRLRIYPIVFSKEVRDMAVYLKMMAETIKREPETDMIVIDSLTPFVTNSPVEDTIGFFEACKGFCNEGQTILLVVHSYSFDESMLIRLRSLCDAHLNLRIEKVGDKLLKVLEVSKVRGATHSTGNIVSFEIEPGWGMRIIPISKASV